MGAGGTGMGGGSGTIIDQSVNGNFGEGGFVDSSSSAIISSGAGSFAAGGDLSLTSDVDSSTNFTAGGDINLNNRTSIDNTIDSNNDYSETSNFTDSSQHWSATDSFNDGSSDWSATGSFNDESVHDQSWTMNANVDAVVDSHDAAILDGVDFGM